MPTFLANSFQPYIEISTGPKDVPANTLHRGIMNLWTMQTTDGTDPPNKSRTHVEPIEYDWELWGARYFMGMARGAIGEMNAALRLTDTFIGSVAVADRGFVGWASDNHFLNGWFQATYETMLPCPYIIPGKTNDLYFHWVMNNLLAGVATFHVVLTLFWRYRAR